MRPKNLTASVALPYDLQVEVWRTLAEAVSDLREANSGNIHVMDAESWIDEATDTLLKMTDFIAYDDIVSDGHLTGPASLIAVLDGWEARYPEGTAITASSVDRFDNNEDAINHVIRRATRNDEPGGKLHSIALSLVHQNAVSLARAKRNEDGGSDTIHEPPATRH